MKKKFLSFALALGTLAAQYGSAQDAQPERIRVVTSGGFTAAFNVLGPIFEVATGIEIETEYGASMGGAADSIPSRIGDGGVFDVLIMNRPPLDVLSDAGHVHPGSRTDLVRPIVGMSVRTGATKPDISTRQGLIDTLLAAESIGFSASVSGTYLSTVVFPSLGIWDEIEPKTLRIESERVAAVVARGEVEIGFQQTSALLPVEGADFVGPIPDELQNPATFSAGIMASAPNPQAAQQLIEFLASESVAEIIKATGLSPVVLETAD